jgi:hypothetical protein
MAAPFDRVTVAVSKGGSMEPIVKSLDRPDQTPELPKGKAQLVTIGDVTVVRGQLEAGWRWSNDWRPLMGTTSCRMAHQGVVLSGRLRFEMDDGAGFDLGPGDVYSIPPGHDAWVVGDEPCRTIDWELGLDEATKKAIALGTSGDGH